MYTHEELVQVATFDELGVSGHPNHIAVHYGVRQWYAATSANCNLRFLVCVSTATAHESNIGWIGIHVVQCSGARDMGSVCVAVQRTVPTAVKFLGPLLVLLIHFIRLCGGLKRSSTLSGSTYVATSSDVLTIKEAMQAHASQYVWCGALFM